MNVLFIVQKILNRGLLGCIALYAFSVVILFIDYLVFYKIKTDYQNQLIFGRDVAKLVKAKRLLKKSIVMTNALGIVCVLFDLTCMIFSIMG